MFESLTNLHSNQLVQQTKSIIIVTVPAKAAPDRTECSQEK